MKYANPLIPLAFDVSSLAVICLFYTSNILLLVLLASLLGLALFLWRDSFHHRLAFFALLIGALGEWACCKAQLWIYANPTWAGLPLWLPLIWPILILTFWRIASSAEIQLSHHPRISRTVQVLGWLLVASYSIFTFLNIKPLIALIFVVFSILMLIWARTRHYLLFFIISAVGGTFGESICMQFDVWYYTNPWFTGLGIPLSLPLAWGLSAVIIVLLAKPDSGTKIQK